MVLATLANFRLAEFGIRHLWLIETTLFDKFHVTRRRLRGNEARSPDVALSSSARLSTAKIGSLSHGWS